MSTAVPAVEAVLEAAGPHVRELMERLERRLVELVGGHGELLAAHAGATIEAGGKRLRPLTVFVAGGEAAAGEGLVRAAAAVELVHSATLVHDDVLDAADLRRGQPTVVARAGRGVAIATGDLLFSRAFAELAANRQPGQLRMLSAASSALARGELLQRADAFDQSISVERYLLRCELKTARLFEAACELGAAQAPADDEAVVRALGQFGRRIGLAFQLLDDVLDVSGPPERTGKRRGTDLLDGTVTLPLILARERDPALARMDLRYLGGAAGAEQVCDAIESTGALEQARARALETVAQAKAGLPALDGRRTDALVLIADSVAERYA